MLLKSSSSHVAFGGIFTALSVLFLLLSCVIPFGRLVFVFLTSAVVGVAVNMFDKRLAFFVYAATSLLSIFVVPDKSYAALYVIVVGNYPLVKPLLEKIYSVPVCFALKLVCFNVYMVLCYIIAVKLLSISFDLQYSIFILWALMLAAFYVYDYAYSLFMQKIYYAIPKNKF